MTYRDKQIIFLLFLVSGFCGLLYQVVWIRMAYAAFGVITPVLSIVISTFMLGLAIGSWAGGKWIEIMARKTQRSPLVFYAATEFLIGAGAFCVPFLFSRGQTLLLGTGSMDSIAYLLSSAVIIVVTLLPWCVLMGFTYPFMMSYVKASAADSATSFSYLYLANVIGAMLGTLVTAVVLIELLGFDRTLTVAAVMNIAVAGGALLLAQRPVREAGPPADILAEQSDGAVSTQSRHRSGVITCGLLFLTGFTSLGMEVVWIRAFTPVLRTMTYSFAGLLSVYLLATWLGSFWYRVHSKQNKSASNEKLFAVLAMFAFLPVVMADPRLEVGILASLFSIFPFCTALGYLTPCLIDTYSAGHPESAGRAYALNIAGCVAGPLFASYILIPGFGVRLALINLGVPYVLVFLAYARQSQLQTEWSKIFGALTAVVFVYALFINASYEDIYQRTPGARVRSDHTATVVAVGSGFEKKLLINGIGITSLTPITKEMAHIPLALLPHKPQSILTICFGMGTTHRSALSWDIQATAVELVPSVIDVFDYYFKDAPAILDNPASAVVIDDGRRFLQRTAQTFDVITIDPPPPIEAAGSSLLYSEDFYALVKKRLKPGGILQQWFPYGEKKILSAVARSLYNSFNHIHVYKSIDGWGYHFSCSQNPFPFADPDTLARRLPDRARVDLMEWYRDKDVKKFMQALHRKRVPLQSLLSPDEALVITDDHPFNEYFVLRRTLDRIQNVYEFAY